MRKNSCAYSFILLFFLPSLLFTQNGVTGHPDWFIKTSYNKGFILEHRSNMGHLVKGYPDLYEIAIGKPTLGDKLWHCENNFPELGLTFNFIDFKNPLQLGYAYALAPYAEIPLNKNPRVSRLILRLCWGITYLDKPFDIETNSKNVAIGSHWNSFVQFKWFWQLKLSDKVRFEPGFAFSHASNARAKVPNLGLNLISANAALNITLPGKSRPEVKQIDSSCRARSRNELLLYGAFGYNEREVGYPLDYCGLFSAEYHRNVRNTHKFGFGVDFFLDENYMTDYLIAFNREPEGFDRVRVAAKISYAYNLGKVSFPIDVGYYVWQKTLPDGFLVSRIGMKYYSSSGLVFSLGLRTHFAVAYDFEYGIGYRIYLKD